MNALDSDVPKRSALYHAFSDDEVVFGNWSVQTVLPLVMFPMRPCGHHHDPDVSAPRRGCTDAHRLYRSYDLIWGPWLSTAFLGF